MYKIIALFLGIIALLFIKLISIIMQEEVRINIGIILYDVIVLLVTTLIII